MIVSQSVTKKMQFFFFQSVVFTLFLRYIYMEGLIG